MQKAGINVFLHAFLDGRDTPPKSALRYLQSLKNDKMIKTICGRYYAMDRYNNWDRIKLAYDVILHGVSKNLPRFKSAEDAVEHFYQKSITDEFILYLIS